jgi:hypothetical protein
VLQLQSTFKERRPTDRRVVELTVALIVEDDAKRNGNPKERKDGLL